MVGGLHYTFDDIECVRRVWYKCSAVCVCFLDCFCVCFCGGVLLMRTSVFCARFLLLLIMRQFFCVPGIFVARIFFFFKDVYLVFLWLLIWRVLLSPTVFFLFMAVHSEAFFFLILTCLYRFLLLLLFFALHVARLVPMNPPLIQHAPPLPTVPSTGHSVCCPPCVAQAFLFG